MLTYIYLLASTFAGILYKSRPSCLIETVFTIVHLLGIPTSPVFTYTVSFLLFLSKRAPDTL